MNKIILIIKREYLSRVKKKSFLLMTFLVPGLIIGMYALVGVLTMQGSDTAIQVDVIDQSGVFASDLKDTRDIDFTTTVQDLEKAKQDAYQNPDKFVLFIPANINSGGHIEMYSQKKAGLMVQGDITDQMNDIMRTQMLKAAGINMAELDKIKPNLSITSKELTPEGEKDSSTGAAFAAGFAAAILIYISLFIYGAQVMRGVIEEKTSRIIEVMISSVKPFQLMMGKIIGIGLVGLTQFLLWIALSTTLMTVASKAFMPEIIPKAKIEQSGGKQAEVAMEAVNTNPAQTIFAAVDTIDFKLILSMFIIYFLGGFMLYSALFAAVGSAVDSETETQQFMFPITLPLLFTYILSFSFIVNHPDSTLSFWLSIIPFTSPVAMMVRLPFGVPAWQLGVSITLLIAGFICTTWVASRIYRVGILMYGKKISYKELVKWFFYKE